MSEHNHDCGCGHDHDHDHDHELIITMVDEDGNEIDMAMVETFNVDEQLYALLLQRNDPEADGIIVRLEEQGEEMAMLPIEDDAEWERVQQAYNELVAEQGE
ncbi:DUF1292 domain-containing protein [Paenibacillus alvei]|uniref:UPF0473 protein HMI46_03595 n=1 Tax=Paenibacillus alvei TaxID=44250 RepID=A0AAP7DGP3_PAEAL|nr:MULTISPECIES: DUF1292 domain-containing protein [Paenibacillus]EJW17464.1 hypothetical protein PAV_4c05750 [Paenibacillus alvei DSM 29]MBG9734045.1 hypothetical protein [Paenibacillus alvei]MBG9744410.1 hypothetical protein [Paenibacillus alvei]MCY7487076.1 DUF1292 domain-containing protein [Paenibacillus alvei]MCY9540340.1 DUF1292 domain-containing protein [Paenibacillus alvei]